MLCVLPLAQFSWSSALKWKTVCSHREDVDEVLSTEAFVKRGVFLAMLLLVLSSLEYSPVLIFWFVAFLLAFKICPRPLAFSKSHF